LDKSDWIFDIEIFPNFFDVTFLNASDKNIIKTFIVAWDLHIDEKEKLVQFLDNEVSMLIGYNNLFYDAPILLTLYEYNGKNVNADLFDLSKKIIGSDREENFAYKRNYPWLQMDLMKMMAFDKLGISLKQCAINLRWHKIQDLPLPYDTIIKREDIETIIKYNINDVLISYELYRKLEPQITLRNELSDLYQVELRNASDSKIANVLLEKFYTDGTGVDIRDIKYKRTKREFLWLKECICSGIRFQTKKLRNLKFETLNTLVVGENNWAYKKEIEFGNCEYELGVGGLHSKDTPGKFVSDENFIIRDADVASYYPNIIINNKIKPDHLNEDFVEILKKITAERLDAKKSGNKVKADGLKITVNSIFGKLGSETFWLEDPRAMLTVTVSGQLYLMMLIEMLTIKGIIVLSANTDGIVSKIPRKLESEYNAVCDWWQKETGFELEATDYDLYIRSDVNNYVVRKIGGSTKEKGRYVREIDLKRGYHCPIVASSIYQYFVNNKSLDENLSDDTDIFDYCLSQKTGKDFIMEMRDGEIITPLQKTNRYFISKSGAELVKVNRKTGTEIGLSVGNKCKLLNDYDPNIPFSEYDVDYDFYKEEALKYIEDIECAVYPQELQQEELADESEEGIELDIDNVDTSKIIIKSPKFRFSESSYYFDKKSNIIYRGIGSIKYVTSDVAKQLKNISKNYYSTFIDLLIELEETCSINSRQLETLIKLNFFEEFGGNKKLLDIFNEFNSGKNRYNKKLKSDTKDKRILLLKEYELNCPNKKINVLEQILWEKELLGYTQSVFDVDKRYVYVNKINEKYSPRLDIHCLNTGKDMTIKVQKGIYENNPILGTDIMLCKTFQKKKAVRFVDGKFIEDDQKPMVWWLETYTVLTNEEIDKLI
jgi:hypothetical protein